MDNDTTEPLRWRKPWSGGNGGSCVEIAPTRDGGMVVRNSTDPDGPRVRYTAKEWLTFVEGVKSGDFDADLLPGYPAI